MPNLLSRLVSWILHHEPRTNLGDKDPHVDAEEVSGPFGESLARAKPEPRYSQSRTTSLLQRLVRGERAVIFCSVAAFVLLSSAFVLAKLSAHGYNALDLAIFSQVIDKTAHGHLFGFGIHPHLYLGDHIDFSLLFFVPFWLLNPHPGTLLVLQNCVLALGVWPLWLLVRQERPDFRLGIVWVYLGTVLVHNIAAFEFHTLALIVPLLLFAAAAYERRKLSLLWIALGATLLVREDMGLVVAGFGLLALVERQSWRWSIPFLLLGTFWFFAGIYATGFFNHDQYKFLAYYSWLGASIPDIVKNAFLRPWLVLEHLFAVQNIVFALATLLLFAGLPVLAWKKLLPVFLFAAALFLTGFGGDEVTLRTHYMSVFVPFLLWATVGGLKHIREHGVPFAHSFFDRPAVFAWLALIGTTLYGFFTLSPFGPAGIRSLVRAAARPDVVIENDFLKTIPRDAHVAASYALLPDLATRPELYSLHYAFSGKRQLSTLPYTLPDDTDWILYDSRDYLSYTAEWGPSTEQFTGGNNRLRSLIQERGFELVALEDSYILLHRSASVPASSPLYTIGNAADREQQENATGRPVPAQSDALIQLTNINGQDSTLHTEQEAFDKTTIAFLPVTLTWKTVRHAEEPYHLRLQVVDDHGAVQYERWYPIAYGLFPTPEWAPNEPVTVRYRFLIPKLKKGTYAIQLQVATFKGYLTLDPKLSARIAASKQTLDGKPWVLGTFSQK